MRGLVLFLALICAPWSVFADDRHHKDHDRARQLMRSGEILSLERILEHHPQVRDGRLLEVQLKRRHEVLIYEVEFMDRQGRVVEMEFDAKTGQLLRQHEEN
ncbi:MAG: PepSY domain-containing protein [Magnetococcales bacterium]|nr:PepSY domain-containing protein [Magnetococcales bacterium]